MTKIFKKKVFYPIVSALVFMFSFIVFFVNSPNAYAADLKTVVLKTTDFTGEGEGSDNPWTLSNSSWAISNLAFYNYWNKDEISKTEAGQGSAFSSSITYNNPSKYAIVSVKVYGAGQNFTNTVNVSVTCGSETTAIQTVTQDKTDLTFNLSTNPTSSVVINFQHPAHEKTATIEMLGTGEKGNVTFIEITGKEVNEVSIAAGTGVKSVYLSTNQNATSGSSSGTKFDKGTTVYGFAELAKGYKAKSGWTKVSGTADTEGAKYRVASVSAGSNNFGTISADIISYTIGYTLNGGSVSGNPTSYNVTSNAITLKNPTKTGYTFKGWTGSNGSTPQTSVSIAKGSIGNRTYTANWILLPVIQDVIDKIDAIGTVTYSGSKGSINTARSAYDALDASYKGLISNYETLTTAEGKYNTLKTNAVNNVKNLIDTIGTVAYPTSKAAIEAAESAYAALDSDEKNTTVITNYATLTGARTEYDAQKNAAVQAVIAAIDAIGEITYPGSKAAIMNAEDLYDALDEDEKNTTTITNYTTLTGDRTEYNSLRDAAVLDVIDKIDDIELPLVYPGSNTQISSARSAYDALGEDEKNTTVITNYQDLLDVEAAYQVVVEENEIGTPYDTKEFRDKVLAVRNNYNDLTNTQKSLFPDSEYNSLVNYEKGISVMDSINAIGNVVITSASKALIDTANEAYEALTDVQKELVVNYGKLVQANTDYDKALEVVNKIDAIGEGEYSKEKQALINNARDSYNKLTLYQQSIVYNYQKLLDAEIDATEALIDNIGNIKYTSDCKALIDKARASYNALSKDQQALVENYSTLTKDETDYSAVDKVVKDINNIGDITYDEASDNKIKACRKLDNELTNDQKAILPQESENTLVSYEKAYSVLVKINSIGTVEYSEETEELIKDAREAYDGLSPDQKKLINDDDYSVLSTKEEELDNITSTAITWGVILVILASLMLCAGLLFIWFLLFKRDDDDENSKKPQTTKVASSILPLVILASHFGTGPYRAFYIILILAALAWIAVLVIYILKKKGIIKVKNINKEETIIEEVNNEEDDGFVEIEDEQEK